MARGLMRVGTPPYGPIRRGDYNWAPFGRNPGIEAVRHPLNPACKFIIHKDL